MPGWALLHCPISVLHHLGLFSHHRNLKAIIGGWASCDNGWMGLGNFEGMVFFDNRWRVSVIISTER